MKHNLKRFRSGLTLIELIFTMVIIAFVFSVIPKIMFSLNKSDTFAIRQDAMFNGISLVKNIMELYWDINDTEANDILLDTNRSTSVFDCNTTTNYRVGGFVGSRNCKNKLNATAITTLQNEIYLANSIGELNNTEINATYGNRNYELNVTVDYISDDNNVFNFSNQSVSINLNKATTTDATSNPFTNLKKINVSIWYASGKRPKKQITQFCYISSNIGLWKIRSRAW